MIFVMVGNFQLDTESLPGDSSSIGGKQFGRKNFPSKFSMGGGGEVKNGTFFSQNMLYMFLTTTCVVNCFSHTNTRVN